MRIGQLAVGVVVALVVNTTASGVQSTIPNLVCRGDEVVSVRGADLAVRRLESTDLYRFASGKLYVSSREREEYFYNDVRQVEPGRYVAGHKTIVSDSALRQITVVHVDNIETRVLRMRCVPS